MEGNSEEGEQEEAYNQDFIDSDYDNHPAGIAPKVVNNSTDSSVVNPQESDNPKSNNQEGDNQESDNLESDNLESSDDNTFYEDEFNEDEEEGDSDDFGGSEPEPLGGIYGLFKDTLNRKDSKKVSNVNSEELGTWNLSVRDCERIALISRTFNHPGVAKFFESQSRIITDTAMSKKGWFAELFVTSKQYASRESSSNLSGLPQQNKKDKWKIFSDKKTQQNPVNQ